MRSFQHAMQRNPAIELFRVFLMFEIVLMHSIGFGEHSSRIVNFIAPGVAGFAFISGWFGVKFSWTKIVKLYAIGLYAAAVFAAMLYFSGMASGVAAAVMGWNKLIHGFWFLHAYALMMMLSPLINLAVDSGDCRRAVPLLFLVWIWGFGRTLPFGDDILPQTAGLDALGGITLAGVYAGARICRRLKIDEKLSTKTLLLCLPLLFLLCGIGLADNNSPIAFVLAAAVFILFSRIRIPAFSAKVLEFLGPSMFSVYLIHTNEFGGRMINVLERYFDSIFPHYAFGIVLAALILFLGAIVLDLPRRLATAEFKPRNTRKPPLAHRTAFISRLRSLSSAKFFQG